jgi:Uma2 family endonuclease
MSAEPIEPLDALDLALARVMHAARRRPLTIADVATLDRTVGRTELIDGVLLLTPNPDAEHLRLSRRLANQLDLLVPPGCEALEGVNVFEPGTDKALYMPDVAVIQTEKLVRVHGAGEGVYPDGLELVIEITSSNRDTDLGVKRERYGSWGVPYLVIDRASDPATLHVFGDWPSWAEDLRT